MKKLITSVTINQYRADGIKEVQINYKTTIVTPEAFDLAKKMGISLIRTSCELASEKSYKDKNVCVEQEVMRKVREKVMAQLGDKEIDKSIIEGVIKKALEGQSTPAREGNICYKSLVDVSGLKIVRGNTIQPGKFEDAGQDKNIRLADIITHNDGSPMSAGIMKWKKEDSFPWKLNYSEIDYVIDGVLAITINGKTYEGHAGDVFYIPEGSEIIFGTPSQVKILYVTYPANWAEKK